MDQAGKAPNVIVNSGTVIWAPPMRTALHSYAWRHCEQWRHPGVGLPRRRIPPFITRLARLILPTERPNTAAIGNNSGGVTLGINSGGVVQLAGPGGNGVNIQANNGVLDNGVFDLGGDAVQVGFIAGSGIVTNSGATLATLNLGGG